MDDKPTALTSSSQNQDPSVLPHPPSLIVEDTTLPKPPAPPKPAFRGFRVRIVPADGSGIANLNCETAIVNPNATFSRLTAVAAAKIRSAHSAAEEEDRLERSKLWLPSITGPERKAKTCLRSGDALYYYVSAIVNGKEIIYRPPPNSTLSEVFERTGAVSVFRAADENKGAHFTLKYYKEATFG